MSLLAWIIVGLLAGFMAKLVVPLSPGESSGFLGAMLLGTVGAVVGGWIWNVLSSRAGLDGVDAGSVCCAFVGSLVLIGLLRVFHRPHAA